MDIQTRKIEFVQSFLNLHNEEVISLFEKLLREIEVEDSPTFELFTIEELNKRIEQSERDFENNRFKTTSELLSKY